MPDIDFWEAATPKQRVAASKAQNRRLAAQGLRTLLYCPYGQDGESVCCGNQAACTGPQRNHVSLLEPEDD